MPYALVLGEYQLSNLSADSFTHGHLIQIFRDFCRLLTDYKFLYEVFGAIRYLDGDFIRILDSGFIKFYEAGYHAFPK